MEIETRANSSRAPWSWERIRLRGRIRVEAHPVAVCTIPCPYPIENQRFDSVVQRPAICVPLKLRFYLIRGMSKTTPEARSRGNEDVECRSEGRREIPTVLRSIVAIVRKESATSINPVSIKLSLSNSLGESFHSTENTFVLNSCEQRWHSKGWTDVSSWTSRPRCLTIVLTLAIITGETWSNISQNSAVFHRERWE